jgi:peptide/nickel transport system permease protein
MLVTMFVVSVAIFFIAEVMPIDVARNIMGRFAMEESVEALRVRMGLNCPTAARYVIWLIGDDWIPPARDVLGEGILPLGCTPEGLERNGLLRGDLGTSHRTKQPVGPYLFRRLKNSLILGGIASLITMPIALVLGVLAGLREGSFMDRFISLAGIITTASPSFASGVIFVVIFALWLGWLPGVSAMVTEDSAFDSPEKLVMPIMVLFFSLVGYVARITRASMVQEMHRAYVRTGILKGLSRWKVVFKHAMRNALLAPITVIMIQVNWLLGGVVVVEMLFGFPGLGSALLQASLSKDLYMIEAGALIMTFLAVTLQLTADILYVYLNPRIRYA